MGKKQENTKPGTLRKVTVKTKQQKVTQGNLNKLTKEQWKGAGI